MSEPKYAVGKTAGANHVWLHIYDIDPVTSWLNDRVLAANDWGAYHVGVEVKLVKLLQGKLLEAPDFLSHFVAHFAKESSRSLSWLVF